MPSLAKVYISVVSALGVACMAYAFADPLFTHNLFRFWAYFVLSLLAATLKLHLPGISGTMSLGFLFVLLGISELTLPETMLIASTGVIVQCLWRAKQRPAAVQVLFSVSTVAAALLLAYGCSHLIGEHWHSTSMPLGLAAATCLYFFSNSLLVSGVLALVKQQPLRAIWLQCNRYAFPYYLLGGAVVGLMTAAGRDLGWQTPLAILPVMGLVFLFYRIYLCRPALESAAER